MGRFAVRVDGEEVDRHRWARQSAKALVKLLALAPGHSLHREQVIDQLWPHQDATAGINSLNKAIHAARRALEPALARGGESRFLLTPRNQVLLASPGALHVDLLGFEQAANQAVRLRKPSALREALKLYGGTLLIDDLYEPWSQERRESAQVLFRSASLSAAEWFAGEGEPAHGIEIVQRWLLEDPADEAAHCVLMELYAACGQAGQALRHFELACRALRAAGVEPGSQIRRLQGAIGSTRREPEPATRPAYLAPGGAATDASWSPQVTPLTFRPGVIRTARFLPDGESVLLTANWDGTSVDLYRLTCATGSVQAMPWRDVELFAVSPGGGLALGRDRKPRNMVVHLCTLSVVPARGDVPIDVANDVQWADWHPRAGEGREDDAATWLAIVRDVAGRCRLEFPIGTVRFESRGWISHLRFSPDGQRLAFIEHKIEHDDEGDIMVIELGAGLHGAREARLLAKGFLLSQGLAWKDQELWFTASRKGLARALRRIRMDGSEQLMHSSLGNLKLHDASPAHGLLVTADRMLIGTMARRAGEPVERDISWHDYTTPRDISADGLSLLVEEGYTTGRQHYMAYLRRSDGSATQAIGEGVPLVLSPDQRKLILRVPSERSSLAVVDLQTRKQLLLPNDDAQALTYNEFVSFFPDGRRIVFSATDAGGGLRIYLQDLAGGPPLCFTPGEVGVRMPWNRAVAPDGRSLILLNPRGRLCRYPAAGGAPTPLTDADADPSVPLHLVAWCEGGQAVFVYRLHGPPTEVYRLDLATGRLSHWLTLDPSNVGAVSAIRRLRMTADGRSYAYGFARESSDLYQFMGG